MTKIPFEEEELVQNKKSVKLDNSKSRFAKNSNEQKYSEAEFNESVAQHQDRDKALHDKIAVLSASFMNFVKDKTLIENKSPIQLNLEKSTSRELINLALELNSDQNKPEGVGSCGLLMLLLRTVLAQRDTINALSYELNEGKKEIKKIREMVVELDQRTIGSLKC